jgi:F-type H+-transporting ATPase subunit delta
MGLSNRGASPRPGEAPGEGRPATARNGPGSALTGAPGACYAARPHMIEGSIARRYAKALFSLAAESGRVEPWAASLEALREAVEASPDLRDVLSNPVYSKEQRRPIVEKLAGALSLDPQPASLLFLLGDRNRLGYLAAVVDTFRSLADEHLGRVRAKVTSAVKLDEAAAQAIADKLSQATKAKVLLDRVVDPAILGGVVAQVGSLVYDGSLRAQLEDLRKQLKR